MGTAVHSLASAISQSGPLEWGLGGGEEGASEYLFVIQGESSPLVGAKVW